MGAIFNWRYWVLMVFVLMAIVGISGEPKEDCGAWFLIFVSTKLGGVSALLISWRLAERWMRDGSVPELTRMFYYIMED